MSGCDLPFAHLNLRRNPFGEFTEREREALALVDVELFVQRLSNPRYAVQFVGEKGYGKTTHLLALRAAFRDASYLHIGEGERIRLPTGSPILIDEAQRLTPWQRVQLFRRSVPLVLGTHQNFERQLRRAGRTVETIDTATRTSAAQLHTILNQRIGYVRRGDGPVPRVSRKTSDQLRARFGHDIRQIQNALYATFQSLREIGEV